MIGTVIFKLWDSWKHPAKDHNNEVAVYKRLEPIWGVCVPTLLAFGAFTFCHSLVIDYIDNVTLFRKTLLT